MTDEERKRRFLMFLSLHQVTVIKPGLYPSYVPLCCKPCVKECPYFFTEEPRGCLEPKGEDFRVVVKKYPVVLFFLHGRIRQ